MKKQYYYMLVSFFVGLIVLSAQVGYSMKLLLINPNGSKAIAGDPQSNDISRDDFDQQRANAAELVKWVDHGVDTKDAAGVTPLMNAVITGNRRLFEAALKLGASLHLHDNQGRTAYYYATQKLTECEHQGHIGHEHCCPFAYMQEKLAGGVNEIDPSNDMTPLMTAAQAGNVPMVLWLLSNGADFKKVGNYNKTKTAFNVAKDESVKAILKLKGADTFEADYVALQAKKREEIRTKLLQDQQKKQQAQIHSDALYERRIKGYLENNTMAVKSFLFGAVFNIYKKTINHHLDPAVIECKRDLLQRVFVRLLLTCKNKGHAPEQVHHVLGDSMTHMVMQAGCFLGEKRLALMGCKKKGPLAFSELVRLVYAQDKKITRESDKIDADVDIILFMSHWKRSRPLLKVMDNSAPITSAQAHNILQQIKGNVQQITPEQMQVMCHVQNEIYKLLLDDYPRAVQAVASAQDSLGNSPLHYAVVLNDFELAKDLIGAQAALEKFNARKTAPLDLIIKMGNSDQLKDLFVVAGNSIKPTVFKKAVPTEKEVEALVKVSAAAGAGRGNPVKIDAQANLEVVQDNLKKDILRAALAQAPLRPANNVVAAQPEQVDAQKLANLQKAQELEAAQLAKEQEAQKIAKQAAKKAAKKERRKATKMEEEQAIEQLKLDAEKKRHADELLARNKKAQQRAEQDKAQANRAFEEAQLHEQKRKLELEKLEQVQQKRIEVQQKLEQAQLSAQASKLELERQLQESAAQKIYFQHTARPDIYIDEDQAPTDYAQWLHEHSVIDGAYCQLCNNAQVIKTRDYQNAAVQEQLQRRKTAMDWEHREQALLVHKEQERLKKLEVARKKKILQEQLAERVKQVEQRLSPQNKQA